MAAWSTIFFVSEWVIRFIMLVYVPQQRSAAATRTWLLLIFLLPWPGLALYAIFGRIRLPRKRIEQQMVASQRIIQAQLHQKADLVAEAPLPEYLRHIPPLAAKLGDFGPFGGNSVELLDDYDVSLQRLIADIDAAQKHVHLLTYIFATDGTGEQVIAALRRAAERGIPCWLLLDAVGSAAALARWAEPLRREGIEVTAMLPVGFWRKNAARFDLRNHRKVAVIDGQIGYLGSQNIVDAHFVPGHPNEELVARLTGPVVLQMQAVLLADRFIETDAVVDLDQHLPATGTPGGSTAQLVPSGPGFQRENAAELFIALLYAARRRVVITTPYFVPDEAFLSALCAAAQRGVEVRLIVSRHANQRLTQLAQRSYYDDLLTAGVRVHLYRPRFLHAKHLSVDDSIAVIGSSNIDIRSFALNAEVSLILYDVSLVAALRRIQERYLAESDALDLEGWRARPLIPRVAQSLARLADSVL